MKRILLALFLAVVTAPMFAQTGDCTPDPMYTDSVGVFPQPFIEGVGGIPDTACLNTEFQTNFTLVVDTFNVGGFEGVPDWIMIDSVTNLPAGLTYKCNPVDCKYLPQTPGCASVYGIPEGEAGVYSLVIHGRAAFLGGLVIQEVTFPDPTIAPGEYLLYVRTEEECNGTAVQSIPTINKVNVAPNPFNGFTTINIEATEAGTYDYAVTDLLGKTVATTTWKVQSGANSFTFDGSNLAKGIYIYTLRQGNQVNSGKLIVSE